MSKMLNRERYDLGPYAPVSDERTEPAVAVRGQIPAELRGMFVQNGPNPRFSPPGFAHWFDGDGMVHGVDFRDGVASYRNRWIRTRGLEEDLRAGRATRAGILMPFEPDSAEPDKDTANTDLVFHDGKLLALWYLGGQPYALDPETLATLGPETFGDSLSMHMAAHPKVCPDTGELLFIDFNLYREPWLKYGVVSADGRQVHSVDIEIPAPTFMHDIAITPEHTIFLDLPMTWDQAALARGRRKIAFHRDTPARFGVVPRHGTEVRWFEAPSCYCYHTINAWEERNADGERVIVLTACRISDPMPTRPHEDEPDVPRLTFLRLEPYFWEWRLNLDTGGVSERPLGDVPTEFPRMNDAWLGHASRYSYHPRVAPMSTLAFDAVVKYDTVAGTKTAHELGDRICGESVFVQRDPSAGRDAAEDDGWVLAFTHARDGGDSEMRIIDAATMDAEPVAVVELRRRVPMGFHAAWAPGSSDAGAQP